MTAFTKGCITLTLLFPNLAQAHDDADMRVEKTVHDSESAKGDPITITWGIVPDGTSMPNSFTPSGVKLKSNFVASIDKAYNVEGAEENSDYSGRPWFKILQKSLSEFESKTGVTYEYVPYDDGSKFVFKSSLGIKNKKADLRIGGLTLDTAKGVRAYSGYPGSRGFAPNIVFNTAHPLFSNKHNLHYLMAHENMHNLGIGHMLINQNPKLSAVDNFGLGTAQGPQFDDLLALHLRYGDKYEKNGGNDSIQKATKLGELTSETPLGIGLDAKGLVVKAEEIDFVSIDGKSDTDVYTFTVKEKVSATITLTPRGPEYNFIAENISRKEQQINASKLNDLQFTLSKKGGRKLTINKGTAGEVEDLTTDLAPGIYYISVQGKKDEPQFYSIEASVN